MSSSNVIKILAEVQRSVCNHARQWDEAARILRDKVKSVTKPTDLASSSSFGVFVGVGYGTSFLFWR